MSTIDMRHAHQDVSSMIAEAGGEREKSKEVAPDEDEDDCQTRREAELEFVSSAYAPDEAWCTSTSSTVGSPAAKIHRRLKLCEDDMKGGECNFVLTVTLTLPRGYPARQSLDVDASIEAASQLPTTVGGNVVSRRSINCSSLQKIALNAIPSLLSVCRQVAKASMGEESVFAVLNAAEAWLREQWSVFCEEQLLHQQNQTKDLQTSDEGDTRKHDGLVLGRRLIYSHHIISKAKRGDIKGLASDLKLTGYMKIGWPGLLIVEGREEDCNEFYDLIRPWSWQYLVVRGEQREVIDGPTLDSMRRFSSFEEVEEASVVAEHCRRVGLEALFLTSMKVYDIDGRNDVGFDDQVSITPSSPWYGTLVHVDHMNDGKGYRKWLRKIGQETDCFLFVKQYYRGGDYSNRPTVLVGVVGDKTDVSTFMKRWRTSRVDVDAKGKACLERQMKIVSEGELRSPSGNRSDAIDWEKAATDEKFTTSEEQMKSILQAVGGEDWSFAPLGRYTA